MIDSRLCEHKISNQILMEYAFGYSVGVDMSKTVYDISSSMLREALTEIVSGEHRDIRNSELVRLTDKYESLGIKFAELLDMNHAERLHNIFSNTDYKFNGEESTMAMMNTLYDIFEHTFKAMMHYKPQGIYMGRIIYFNATEGLFNFYPNTDKEYVWSDSVIGDFEIQGIQANHSNIIGIDNYKNLLPFIIK